MSSRRCFVCASDVPEGTEACPRDGAPLFDGETEPSLADPATYERKDVLEAIATPFVRSLTKEPQTVVLPEDWT